MIKIRNDRQSTGTNNIANIPIKLIPKKTYCEFENKNIADKKNYAYCDSLEVLVAIITPYLENGKQGIVPRNFPKEIAFALRTITSNRPNKIRTRK